LFVFMTVGARRVGIETKQYCPTQGYSTAMGMPKFQLDIRRRVGINGVAAHIHVGAPSAIGGIGSLRSAARRLTARKSSHYALASAFQPRTTDGNKAVE
jgi:hypothetical protein